MTLLKGRFKSVEIAEDGSSVKVRTQEGDAMRLAVEDFEAMLDVMVNAMTAAKAHPPEEKDSPNRYIPPPPVVFAADTNVSWMDESDCFSIEATDERGRKAVVVLREAHIRHLMHVHQQTRNMSPDRELH